MPEVYQFSESFQAKILALLIRDKATFMSYGEVIKPSYFRKAIHVDIARIVHEFYEAELQRSKVKGTEVNSPTLEVLFEEIRKLTANNKTKDKLKDQYQDTVCDLVDLDLTDKEYIKDNIIKFGRRSALEQAILKSVDDIQKGTDDFSVVEDRISKAIRIGEDVSDLGVDYFDTAEERIRAYESGSDGVRRIPTGLVGIDKITKGGLGVGELGVIIAPPNRGKSFALSNIGAGAVMEGFNVVHFTLEMPEKQVAKRYDLRMVRKDFDYVKTNISNVLTAINNIHKIHKGKLFIKKYRTNECSVNTFRSYLTRLFVEKGFVPDLIIVDYADLVQPRKSYSDKRFELESVYLDLRDLGDEYDCPVWTASQTNRGALDKKTITLSDLAEAFNKANIADFMVSLCQTVEEKEDGIMRWYVAKQRDGVANVQLEGDIDYTTATMLCHEVERQS